MSAKRTVIAIVCILLLVGVGTVVFLGLGKPAPQLRVGYIPFNADLPFFVALDKGLLDKHGVSTQAVRCGDSTEALNALLSGQVDVVAGLTFSIYFSAEQASPGSFRLFIPFSEEDPQVMSFLLVANDSGIANVDQLRGKTIGTYTGATQLLYLKLFLRSIGLDPEKDVKLVQVSPNLQAQTLMAKRMDALFTVEPYGTIALQQGAGKLLVANPRSKYIQKPFWFGASAVSTRFWQKNPDVVKRFNAALNDAVDLIGQNEVEVKKVLPRYTPMDEKTSLASGLYRWYKSTDILNFAGVQETADLLSKYDIVTGTVNAPQMFLSPAELTEGTGASHQ